MYADTIEGFAKVAEKKLSALRQSPGGFFVSSMLAGAYVGMGIILIFVLGNQAPVEVRKLIMGATFGIALTLVIIAGAELFTGHTMFMSLRAFGGAGSLRDIAASWSMTWIGNLAGSLALVALFAAGGGGGILAAPDTLLMQVASLKMNDSALALFARAILCNWLVCLAIWMSARVNSDSAKCIVIFWCLLAFIASGFEHSVANMTLLGLSLVGNHPATGSKAEAQFIGPDKIHREAQDRVLAAGGKLVREEEAKRAKHPFDMWDEIAANAAKGEFPKGTDVFLYKFHGLFYVAPAQNSFMCRLRNPNGIIDSRKLRAVAAIAEDFGGGYTHITTRANLQIREIAPKSTLAVLERIAEAGLTSPGARADNGRNIPSNPTAGVDPQGLYETRAPGHALYHAILNHRELYGLPRKFNVAFDGGGRVASLEDTNDIGFTAVRVAEGKGVPAGVPFRGAVGGITRHRDFARDLGR